MGWIMATKIALQSICDGKTRNILIGLILGLVMLLLSFIALPTLIFSLPQMAFASESEAKDMTNQYIDILVEYKHKIHENVKIAKRDYINQGKEVKDIKINYPSLSALVSYENVLNKEKYKKSKAEALKLSKDELFYFLDNCMTYVLENKTLVAKVKTSEEIANFFSSEEDRNMFILVYDTMKKTDLDNNVPDVAFSDFDYLEGGIELPYLSQRDKRWANAPYGSYYTIEQAGCGVVSMCMVLNGLIPQIDILPPELAKWSYENGHYVEGVGTAWSLFGALANKYGLNIKNLSRNNPQSILDELAKGHPVVMSLDPGTFINGYHLIVLRGISSDGKIYVNDPWSLQNSQKTWDFSLLLTESSSLSPSCFWAFSTKD